MHSYFEKLHVSRYIIIHELKPTHVPNDYNLVGLGWE